MSYYVMSDIHSCYDDMVNMFEQVAFGDEDTLIFADDYIDIGSQGYEMLKRIESKPENVIFLKGNHDEVVRVSNICKCFDGVYDYYELHLDKNKIVMSHYPIPFWNGQFRDSIHLYGHVHNSHQWNIMENWMNELRQLQDIPMRAYNVGCMMPYMDYTPRTLKEILENN